jgi:hypothetical protein
MSYRSEDCKRLVITTVVVNSYDMLTNLSSSFDDVCLIILPIPPQGQHHAPEAIHAFLEPLLNRLGSQATLITVGEPVDLVHVHEKLSLCLQYQLWISIKWITPKACNDASALPNYHFGAIVHTHYHGSLMHTKTRLQYTYCPACDKTTKDYGGKKHTYNSYGTLLSDVWRDIPTDLEGDVSHVIERLADLFGLPLYSKLHVLDCRMSTLDGQIRDNGKVAETSPSYPLQPTFFHLPL